MNDVQKNLVAEMANLVKLDQKQKNYLFNLGVKKLKVGDINTATDIFQLLVATDSTNCLYAKSLAGSYHAQKDYINAYIMYNYAHIFEKDPAPDYLFFMGICLYEMKELVAAQEKMQAYLKTKDKDFALKAETFLKLIALEISHDENEIVLEA